MGKIQYKISELACIEDLLTIGTRHVKMFYYCSIFGLNLCFSCTREFVFIAINFSFEMSMLRNIFNDPWKY